MAALAAGLFGTAATAFACPNALTGRTLDLGASIHSFGRAQGLPPLPLEPGEYVVTIDDGPNPKTTPKLLEVLKAHCVKATFFLVGNNASALPYLVKAILAGGHGIGSHTLSHADFGMLSDEERQSEIVAGAAAVETTAYGGSDKAPRPRLLRFPGSANFPPVPPKSLTDWTVGQGFVVAGIDFSPQDWRNSPPAESYDRLFGGIGPSGVILFHDGQPNTIALLPMVLDELARRKARIVALGETRP